MAIGIDKDCSTGRVYWSDISSKQILSAKYDGSDKKAFITEGNKNTHLSLVDENDNRFHLHCVFFFLIF